MSKRVGPSHWHCDQCGKNGGVVNETETIPYRWLSMAVVVATPQVAYEQKPRTIHLCDACGGDFLVNLTSDAEDVERLKMLWRRERGEVYREPT